MNEVDPICVTLKYGKGYEDSWAVFRGLPRELRENLVAYFGLEVSEEQTLHEVVLMATEAAHGASTVQRNLGGRVIPMPKRQEAPAEEAQEAPQEDFSWLVEELESAGSIEDLKRLWAKHKAAFTNADVKAAYTKRGKALKK